MFLIGSDMVYSLLLIVLFSLGAAIGHSAEISINPVDVFPAVERGQEKPHQLPHSRVAYGYRNIKSAWLSHPTDRYLHGVLGDALEASRLTVETQKGHELYIELPAMRVFEDLQPRLVDLDADQSDEILLVESDIRAGASLSVYGVINGRLAKRAATPFLGQVNRWLNPLGWGDFDGDGQIDIALVATPHINGALRLYKFTPPTLTLFGEYLGVSTHKIGSTNLELGHVVSASPRDRLLVPDQSHRALLLLEWSPDQWRILARKKLPDNLASSLLPTGERRWIVRLTGGSFYEIVVSP